MRKAIAVVAVVSAVVAAVSGVVAVVLHLRKLWNC